MESWIPATTRFFKYFGEGVKCVSYIFSSRPFLSLSLLLSPHFRLLHRKKEHALTFIPLILCAHSPLPPNKTITTTTTITAVNPNRPSPSRSLTSYVRSDPMCSANRTRSGFVFRLGGRGGGVRRWRFCRFRGGVRCRLIISTTTTDILRLILRLIIHTRTHTHTHTHIRTVDSTMDMGTATHTDTDVLTALLRSIPTHSQNPQVPIPNSLPLHLPNHNHNGSLTHSNRGLCVLVRLYTVPVVPPKETMVGVGRRPRRTASRS